MSPPDFRYHIASLAAVFLALGVGILVGTAFVGAPVVDRQTRLIKRLEGSVADLRKETAKHQESDEALRTLLPGVLRGKLAGRRVLVIQTGPYADAADAAAEAVRLAGGIVERVTLPTEAWRNLSPETTNPAAEPSEPYATVAVEARRLAPLLAAGNAGDALSDFRQRGLLTGENSLSGPARYAVLVGGGQASPGNATDAPDEPWAAVLARSLDIPLSEALASRGISVVGAEPFDAGVSFMRLYQTAGLATVDSIDRSVGRLALPFALAGEKANYGIKPTADRLLPASLERTAEETVPSPAPEVTPP